MKQDYENLESQQVYAILLKRICNVGLVILFLTFGLYIFGILEPLVPLEELPRYWSLPLNEFIERSGAPTGWQWLKYLEKGDYLCFTGLFIFAGVTGVCYLFLLVDFTRKKQNLFIIVVGVELVLIFLAASNLFQIGH